MLLRSIFHLGEEGGAQHVKSVNDDTSHHLGGSQNQERHRQEQHDSVVGLRILVARQLGQNACTPPTSFSHIVLKKMVLPTSPAALRHRSCGFLRVCALCKNELSPNKDVYMYRGDQGFCSEECRWQQILKDESREREAAIMKQRRRFSIRYHRGPRFATAPPVRGAPRRLLAVA